MIVVEILLLVIICFFITPTSNKSARFLWILQLLTLSLAPVVGNRILFESTLTFFNVLFCFVNLYFLIAPWGYANFQGIVVRKNRFFLFYKRILYFVLALTIVVNLVVWAVVMIYIPDISVFKASLGYTELYDSVPYFGLLFRYTSVTRYIGLMAMPIAIYYLHVGNKKEALKAALFSSSTLIAALAFYSRAQIFVYALLWLMTYLFSRSALNSDRQKIIDKYVRVFLIAVVIIFMGITISRFSAMDYYGDRIPKTSMIKNPILYSIVDYSSKGFVNGINQLEVHEPSDVLKGEQTIYDLFMVLSYFHLIPWTTEMASQRAAAAYEKTGLNEGNDSGTFHGYTCRMVKDFGYVITLIVGIIYYSYVKRKTKGKRVVTLSCFTIMVFLLVQSINSIFYATYNTLIFPLLFYLIIRVLYSFAAPTASSQRNEIKTV